MRRRALGYDFAMLQRTNLDELCIIKHIAWYDILKFYK